MNRLVTSAGTKPGGAVLVLYYQPLGERMRPAIDSHLRFLTNAEAGHQVLYLNVLEGVPWFVKHLRFDVVILHNTLLCARWAWFYANLAAEIAWLRRSSARIIAMPQDEYDHSAVLDEWLESLGVSVICSNFGANVRAQLYPRMQRRATFLHTLTGYIDPAPVAEFGSNPMPMKDRPLDVVYRAAHLPYWFGGQGQLKHRIADIVARRAEALGLRVDISTDYAKTITSNHWFHFLGSSKTVIGCESGSSVLDERGLIQKRIRELQAERPDLTFEEAHRMLPPGWDSRRFFAIGPRHLEAIITRTCQILVEGDYDGILLPGRHYISLRRDFGNLDDVLAMIKDNALLETTANRAYDEILRSGAVSYGTFARQVEAVFPANLQPHSGVYWRIVCPLIAANIRVRAWLTPPLGYVARTARAGVGLLKRVVKAGLRVVRSREKVRS